MSVLETVDLDCVVQQEDILRSDALKARFLADGVRAVGLLGSPGSGKTTLLEALVPAAKKRRTVAVIEGDIATDSDARRMRAAGAVSVELNTDGACHLDAAMVEKAYGELPARPQLLFIENVGNLVCPVDFPVGEALRVAVISAAEGEDKPLKYPDMFAVADLLLLNKADLLPHLKFDVGKCLAAALTVNPHLQTLVVSAETGEGMAAFYAWIEARASLSRAVAVARA